MLEVDLSGNRYRRPDRTIATLIIGLIGIALCLCGAWFIGFPIGALAACSDGTGPDGPPPHA